MQNTQNANTAAPWYSWLYITVMAKKSPKLIWNPKRVTKHQPYIFSPGAYHINIIGRKNTVAIPPVPYGVLIYSDNE